MALKSPNTAKYKADPQIGDVLFGQSSKYKVEKFLGQGRYGKVYQCQDLQNWKKMAVKIVQAHAGQREMAILDELKKLDRKKNNMVSLTDQFIYKQQFCLVFEKLDISLFDLMKHRSFRPLSLSEIRIISQQMLVSLNALKGIHVIHADIKADNIMLVNHRLQPFKVKLIDFGLAHAASKISLGSNIQPIGYRAPEVSLGLPFNEAIDMWGLGCITAFLYMGANLYPTKCKYEAMRALVQMQGQPDDQMLNLGICTMDFFTKDQDSSNAPWRLNTQNEYKKVTGCKTVRHAHISDTFSSLNDMVKTGQGERNASDYEDTEPFLSLLRHMLQVDPEKRITPNEALGHHFITKRSFSKDTTDNKYSESANSTIKDCQLEQLSDESRPSLTSLEIINMNGGNVTCSDDPLSVNDETTADISNGPTVTVGLDEIAATGAHKKTPSSKEATSSLDFTHNSNGVNANNHKRNKIIQGLNWFKKLSRMLKHSADSQ